MKIVPILLIVSVLGGTAWGQTFYPSPVWPEGSIVVPLDAAHASPPNSAWFTGVATLQLDGNILSFQLASTGPFYGMSLSDDPSPRIFIHGPTVITELAPFLTGYVSDPRGYDLVVYLPGDEPPQPEVTYRDFFSGSITLSDLQLRDFLSGQSLLTVDFGASGAIAGQIVGVPEPTGIALFFVGLAAMGSRFGRVRKVFGRTKVYP